ncbi:aldose epimerase family protein [Anaerosphaera multitolerans]|uniref:Aldose 1-epimerase n=1 Tax=Anaerosphaera multitolerans TaxID=2487351 RepID=A0A437S640_9FIRM|nr:aldose epimerase family protein [Anaerosphaera multitolerans]RVU54469.1 galactose mutarotase [Anaerosphaera multitolerans]
MNIKNRQVFSTTLNEKVHIIEISNNFLTVEFSNYGAMITKLIINKHNLDLIVGCNSMEEYILQDKFFGATIGRYANRIEKGKFKLNSKEYEVSINEPPNHLHGGFNGFHKKLWSFEIENSSIIFSYFSKNMEEGFPGNLEIKVKYTLIENQLSIEYFGLSDEDTILNLTNHSYFNLNGEGVGDIKNHTIKIASEKYTEMNKNNIPNGNLIDVSNTPLDFQKPISIEEMFLKENILLDYDHNFLLKNSENIKASAYSPLTKIKLDLYTDYPCMQFFTASNLKDFKGKSNYSNFSAFCFEPQYAPNSINIKSFVQPILKKGKKYSHFIKYIFSL